MSSEEIKISKSIKKISDNYENYKKKDEKINSSNKIKNIETFLENELKEINTIVDFEKMEQSKKNEIIKKYINYKEYLFLKENSKNNKLITQIKLKKFNMIIDNLKMQSKKNEEDKKIINFLKKNIEILIKTVIPNIIGGIILIYVTRQLNSSQNGGKKNKNINKNLKILSKYNYSDLENITKDISKLSTKNMNKKEVKSLINKCNKLKDKVPKMRFKNMLQTLSYSTSLLGFIKLQD